ncbi:MAG: OadG family protein [Deferribacterales bacterium]
MTPELNYALKLSLAGMLIVFASLILIAFAISLMRTIDEKMTERKEARNAPEPEPEQTIDNLTLVLISAAASAALQQRSFRIRSVRRVVSRDAKIAGWTMEGRSVLHGSHVLNVKTEK